MKKYTVIETGLMASDQNDSLVKSIISDEDLENGSHIVLGEPVKGDLNTYKAATPTDVTTQEVLVVASPVLVEVNGLRVASSDPRDFINPKGKPARALHLRTGDTLVISANGFTSTPVVGEYAVPVNESTKLKPVSDLSDNTVVAYLVEQEYSISIGKEFIDGYKLRVVKSA